MEDDFLGVRGLVGDYAGSADLAARAGRGRNRDDGCNALGPGTLPPVADILEIPERTVLAGHEGNDLAAVQGAAATQGHHPVVGACLEGAHARLDIGGYWVRADVVE